MNTKGWIFLGLFTVAAVLSVILMFGRSQPDPPGGQPADRPADLSSAADPDPLTGPVMETRPQPETRPTESGLSDNWDLLSDRQKIAANPFGCDLATTHVRSDNGQCLAKQPDTASRPADEVPAEPAVQPEDEAIEERPDHYVLDQSHICTRSIPPVCYLTFQIAVAVDPPDERRLRQELARLAPEYYAGPAVDHFAILGYYYNGSANYLDYLNETPLRFTYKPSFYDWDLDLGRIVR